MMADDPAIVVDAVALVVNGEVVLDAGQATGALPGAVLRGVS